VLAGLDGSPVWRPRSSWPFEGVVDRLDRLLDPAGRSVARRLAAAVGAGRAQPEPGGGQVLGLLPGESLVADRVSPGRGARTCGRARAARRLPRVPRASDRPGTRPPASRLSGDQVRLRSPPPAHMRGAVPVVRPSDPAPSAGRSPARRRAAPGWRRSAAPGRTTTGTAGPGSMRGLPLVGRIHLMGGPAGRRRVPVNPGIARRYEAAGLRWRPRPRGGRLSCPWRRSRCQICWL